MIAWFGSVETRGRHATEKILGTNVMQAGREIEAPEVALIREVVELFPGLSRKELARTLCDHLGWYTAAGTYKEEACRKLLGRLEAQGLVRLPEKRPTGTRRPVPVAAMWGPCTNPGRSVTCSLRQLGSVRLEVVADEQTLGLSAGIAGDLCGPGEVSGDLLSGQRVGVCRAEQGGRTAAAGKELSNHDKARLRAVAGGGIS